MPWAKIIQLSPPILFGLALHPPLPPTAAQDDRAGSLLALRTQGRRQSCGRIRLSFKAWRGLSYKGPLLFPSK